MQKMITARILLCFLCFIALVHGQSNGQQTSPDTATMTALKSSLKLSSKLNWTDPSPCAWTGVGCDSGLRVTRIQIGNSGLSGTLPPDLKNLTSLTIFEVMGNKLTGEIPSLSGLSSLVRVYLHDNGFTSIDPDFFTGLSSLQDVSIGNNPLAPWEIPPSLKDATSLANFAAGNCGFSGRIPDSLWGPTFPSLKVLVLSGNSLQGELPMGFADSPVQILMLNGQQGNEKLNGSISIVQKMTSLTNISLQGNGFSGPIPDLSGLVSLRSFNARENQLTGIVPSSLTGLSSLSDVALGNNLLQGPTPSFKAAKADMAGLNSFCVDTPGTPCDPRVDTLLSIVEAFSYPVRFAQSWKGNDPCNSKSMWVGITCSGGDITVINFKNMGLNGTISPNFANLTSLQVINLSQNNLTGTIPQELTNLSSLKTLDVSGNQIYGEVPDFKPNVVNTSGNPDIGKDGPGPAPGSSSWNAGKIAGSVIGAVLCSLLIAFAVFFFVKKKKHYHKMHPQQHPGDVKITIANLGVGAGSSGSDAHHMMEDRNTVISIQALRVATDNFNEKNILGRGGFGIVYKGELEDGTEIAVKRMESSVVSGKGLDEFASEVAVLTKVRHRNLVKIHGYCLQGNERLLVYQYMPQGTLSRHIFNWKEEGLKPLEWSRRLIIASDVARGVEYLHTLAQQSFIHRDLKSSNILLGDDMHAKVADFGLVRLAPEGNQSIETKIAGTFGYLAPEYADVHLATWFRRMFINRDTFPKAIDKTIEVNEEILGSINKVAALASQCCAREPQQRPNMTHVVSVLVSLVDQWKPEERSRDSVDAYGIDYDAPLSPLEIIEGINSSFRGDNTLTSIPSRPPELDNTFNAGQGRDQLDFARPRYFDHL
ncbi:unnamed protein product, partial [Thlaspi arvense]